MSAFPTTWRAVEPSTALTGRAGFGAIGVTATLSSLNQDASGGGDVSVGGTLNYRLLGGPLVPLTVTLQGGVSYFKPAEGFLPDEDVSAYHFPVGVGFALVIPNPSLSIHPWLAPRVDVAYQKAGGASDTETNFGLSGGLELNLLNGFGHPRGLRSRLRERRGRSVHLRGRSPLRLSGAGPVRSRRAAVALRSCWRMPSPAAASAFDATTLGMPVTMASPAGQPPAGDRFSVSTKAMYGLWGIATLKQPSLRKALAAQLGGGKSVADVKIRVRSRFTDALLTLVTLGLIVPRTVTFEGVVTK